MILIVGNPQQKVLLYLHISPNVFAYILGKTQSGNKLFLPGIWHLFQDSNVPTIEKMSTMVSKTKIVTPPHLSQEISSLSHSS